MVSICGPSIMNSPRSGGGSALYRDYYQNQTGAGRSLKSAKMISDSGIESGSSPELISNNNNDEAPMSRTAQYRKVMKPLLERKRRARINTCLDDLKDIMVSALQSEGESITKLEKADVLELTVRHLRKLKRQNALGLTPQATYAGRFKAGYAHCAQEVSKFVSVLQSSPTSTSTASGEASRPPLDIHVSTRLLSHLGGCIQALETMPPSVLSMVVPQNSYNMAGQPLPPQGHQYHHQQHQQLSPSEAVSRPKRPLTSDDQENHFEPLAKQRRRTSSSSSPEDKSGAWRPW